MSNNKFIIKTHKFRQLIFLPILKFLVFLKITPNGLTLGRLILLIPLLYGFYLNDLWLAFYFYLAFWIFDMFDGDLARYLKIANDKGRFLDTLVDGFAYNLIFIALIYLNVANNTVLAFHILITCFLYGLAIVKVQAIKPSKWVINSNLSLTYIRALGHIILALFLSGYNYLTVGITLVNILITSLAVYYLLFIYKKT